MNKTFQYNTINIYQNNGFWLFLLFGILAIIGYFLSAQLGTILLIVFGLSLIYSLYRIPKIKRWIPILNKMGEAKEITMEGHQQLIIKQGTISQVIDTKTMAKIIFCGQNLFSNFGLDLSFAIIEQTDGNRHFIPNSLVDQATLSNTYTWVTKEYKSLKQLGYDINGKDFNPNLLDQSPDLLETIAH